MIYCLNVRPQIKLNNIICLLSENLKYFQNIYEIYVREGNFILKYHYN